MNRAELATRTLTAASYAAFLVYAFAVSCAVR